MRSKIKTRIKLDVEVNVDVEFDERSGEVAIVGAHIDPAQNVLTPRQIYRSITPGEYSNLDKLASNKIRKQFSDAARNMASKMRKDFPEGKTLSVPVHPNQWEIEMNRIRDCGIPVSTVAKLASQTVGHVLLQPVLCRTPTVYIWNADRSKAMSEEKIEAFKNALKSAKAVSVELQENGSLKATWK